MTSHGQLCVLGFDDNKQAREFDSVVKCAGIIVMVEDITSGNNMRDHGMSYIDQKRKAKFIKMNGRPHMANGRPLKCIRPMFGANDRQQIDADMKISIGRPHIMSGRPITFILSNILECSKSSTICLGKPGRTADRTWRTVDHSFPYLAKFWTAQIHQLSVWESLSERATGHGVRSTAHFPNTYSPAKWMPQVLKPKIERATAPGERSTARVHNDISR